VELKLIENVKPPIQKTQDENGNLVTQQKLTLYESLDRKTLTESKIGARNFCQLSH
jgi:hypothetical protein